MSEDLIKKYQTQHYVYQTQHYVYQTQHYVYHTQHYIYNIKISPVFYTV